MVELRCQDHEESPFDDCDRYTGVWSRQIHGEVPFDDCGHYTGITSLVNAVNTIK